MKKLYVDMPPCASIATEDIKLGKQYKMWNGSVTVSLGCDDGQEACWNLVNFKVS
jgi:hypothetical protein